jgi:hypothetical protein
MLYPLIQHIQNIFWICSSCFIAIGLGKLVLPKGRLRNCDPLERAIFSLALGYAVIAYCIFIFGICQVLYPALIYVFTAIIAVFSLIGWYKDGNAFKSSGSRPETLNPKHLISTRPLDKIVDRTSCFILACCLLFCLLLVLTPETGKDALIYHIGVPKIFLEHNGIHLIDGNVFANYPFFSEMLYMWGLSLRGEILPKAIHFTTAIFILFGMWEFNRRYINNRFEWLPLLIFFSIPSVFMNACTAYTDIMLAFYTFVALYAFINWFNTKQNLWLVLCGLFSGVAMSTKYGALAFPFIGSLAVLWACRKNEVSGKKALKFLSIFYLSAFSTGAPFYLKNWIMTGNPLYPLFYQIFGGEGWSAEQAGYYDLFIENLGMGRQILDYVLLPWNLSFKSQMDSPGFDGIMGPLFFLVLPFILGIGKKLSIEVKILISYCLLAFFFWASSAQQMRYLIPLFPFLSILVGFVFSSYRPKKVIFLSLSIFILSGVSFNGYYIIKKFNKISPINFVAGRESRESYLNRNISSYAMISYVNKRLPEDAYVLTIYMKNLGYLFERRFYSDSMFESYTIETILNSASTVEEVNRALKKRGFTHILYDIYYVLGDISTFSQENRRLFLDFQKKHLELVKSDNSRYFLYRIL